MKQKERLRPLMPKATAIWLIDNTALTFQQIAESCGLHILEIQALADKEGDTLQGEDPLRSGQLSQAEISRCEQDETALLIFQDPLAFLLPKQKKEQRYTPLAYRQERPNGIAWIIKNYPELSDRKICKLLSTTSKTVQSIRQKTHLNSTSIKPQNPVLLGLCTEQQLQEATHMLQRSDARDELV